MVIPNIVPHFLVEDPDRIGWLLGGYLMAQLWEAIKAKVQDYRNPQTHHRIQRIGATGAVLVVLGAVNIWIAAKTEQNYEYTKDVANKSGTCWIDFADNISTRSMITSDNDRLTRVQMTAIDNLLADISKPTPSNMTVEGQLALLQLRASQAHGVVQQALKHLSDNEAERAAHPVKVPACNLAR